MRLGRFQFQKHLEPELELELEPKPELYLQPLFISLTFSTNFNLSFNYISPVIIFNHKIEKERK